MEIIRINCSHSFTGSNFLIKLPPCTVSLVHVANITICKFFLKVAWLCNVILVGVQQDGFHDNALYSMLPIGSERYVWLMASSIFTHLEQN